jgi:hypothetical protein
MKLPPYLDFAFLLSALPHHVSETEGGSLEAAHEEFKLTLLAPATPGLPFKPLGYLLLAYLGNEAVRRNVRELGGGLGKLCKSIGAPELVDRPQVVEDQLLRLGQTVVRVEVEAKKKRTRLVLFPFFSAVVVELEPDGGLRWRIRLSGDFWRILKHTAPAAIPKVDPA